MLERNRFSPSGGVMYPISRFNRNMIPRCIGSTPYWSATGRISGTTMMMAEKISTMFITSMKKFSMIRNTILLLTYVLMNANSFIGICSSTR